MSKMRLALKIVPPLVSNLHFLVVLVLKLNRVKGHILFIEAEDACVDEPPFGIVFWTRVGIVILEALAHLFAKERDADLVALGIFKVTDTHVELAYTVVEGGD